MINYVLFIVLGLLPSLIWLIFYLRRDVHPEPNEMVIKIFVYGMGITVLVAFLELNLYDYFNNLKIPNLLRIILIFFVAVALMEELAKYLVVHFSVLKHPEYDEPIDAMIYMIIAGLGFAAVENILILFPTTAPDILEKTLITASGRFVSATLLHALCAANIGYFLALSFFKKHRRFGLVSFGILTSCLLHGLYDFGIKLEGSYSVLIPAIVLIFLCVLVMFQFRKIKQLKKPVKI